MERQRFGISGWGLGIKGSGFGRLLVLALAVIFSPTAFVAASGSGGERELRITVRVYDYARVSRAALAGAELNATKILRKAGIETVWLDCPLDGAPADAPQVCQQEVGPTEIVLRILPRFDSAHGILRDATLGFSIVPPASEWGTYASVFFDRVEKLAEGSVASPSEILGHAAGHEIGHLLLRSNQHSTIGIMRPRWNQEDLCRASQGSLLFTSKQAEQMKRELAERRQLREVAKSHSEVQRPASASGGAN